MYTAVQIREYSYLLGMLTDLDSLKEFHKQEPQKAAVVENFNAVVLILDGVDRLQKQQMPSTYLALARFFSEEVLENGVLMGTVEKNLKNIVPLILRQGYLVRSKDDAGILDITQEGKELLRLHREVQFLSRIPDECMKH